MTCDHTDLCNAYILQNFIRPSAAPAGEAYWFSTKVDTCMKRVCSDRFFGGCHYLGGAADLDAPIIISAA